MDQELILNIRLDPELATRFNEFRAAYSLNASDFVRKAITERMDRWPEIIEQSKVVATR